MFFGNSVGVRSNTDHELQIENRRESGVWEYSNSR